VSSRRIKAKPPAEIEALARHYRCPDCSGRAKPRLRDGQWRLDVQHKSASCPVPQRLVSAEDAGHRAAAAAGRELGFAVRFSYRPGAPVERVGVPRGRG
jgi:hypothetical protein